MTTGTEVTVIMLLLWSTVDSVPMFFCVFAIGGIAMATALYEPVFAITAAWFDRLRPRAVLVLTVFGGLASVVFVPLTAALVNWLGWRGGPIACRDRRHLLCSASALALVQSHRARDDEISRIGF